MRSAPLALWLSGFATACGLRSDPLFEQSLVHGDSGQLDSGDSSDEGPSACEEPIEMPMTNITVTGELEGGNSSEGWCGADDGPETVYRLTAAYTTDVTLKVAQSEVPLTLRVVEGGCDTGGVTRVCATDFAETSRHFLAVAGVTYDIIVDTQAQGGGYAFDVIYGWPTLDQCTIHEEVIVQQPGGSFVWFNEFGEGQGTSDGLCGGPGRENMFYVATSYVGNIYATAEGSGGFEPVLSLRTSCAGLSELTCASGSADGFANLQWTIDAPGTAYYLSVDQVGYAGGSYSLSVAFD